MYALNPSGGKPGDDREAAAEGRGRHRAAEARGEEHREDGLQREESRHRRRAGAGVGPGLRSVVEAARQKHRVGHRDLCFLPPTSPLTFSFRTRLFANYWIKKRM